MEVCALLFEKLSDVCRVPNRDPQGFQTINRRPDRSEVFPGPTAIVHVLEKEYSYLLLH